MVNIGDDKNYLKYSIKDDISKLEISADVISMGGNRLYKNIGDNLIDNTNDYNLFKYDKNIQLIERWTDTMEIMLYWWIKRLIL